MAELIRASVIVNFGEELDPLETNNLLILQVDSREADVGGLNNGRTSFFPGENVFILRFVSDSVSSVIMRSNVGSLSNSPGGGILVTEILEFFETDRVNLPYPVSSGWSYNWLGDAFDANDVSVNPSMSLIGDSAVRVSDGRKVQGQLLVQYNANYSVFRLSSVTLGQALVYARGTVDEV